MLDFIDKYLNKIIFHFGKVDINGHNILNILFIYFGTLVLLYFIRFILELKTKKTIVDKKRRHSVYLLFKYFFWIFAIILMIKSTGIEVTYLLAGSAALFVGIGLGVQDIFKDIVSGIFMLTEGVIRIDDILEIDGNVGRVVDIKLRTSDFITRTGTTIVVPNHKFITEKVINWSHNLSPTRFSVEVGVSYNANEHQVRDILLAIAATQPMVISNKTDRKPFVRIVDFGDSAVIYELFFWSSDMFFIENTKSDIRFDIRTAFRENKIEIPFPQRVMHMPPSKTD